MAVDVGAVLSQAWQTVIKHKVLWVLGFIVALLEFSANNSNYKFSSNDRVTLFNYEFTPGVELAMFIIAVAVVIALAFFLLRAIFDAGLIAASDRSVKEEEPTFREAWRAGTAGMWPVLIFNLIFAGLIILLILAMALILGITIAGAIGIGLSTSTMGSQGPNAFGVAAIVGWALLGLIALIVIAVPLLVAFAVITQFAQRAAVLDHQTIGQAWSTGWEMLKHNKLNVVIVLIVQMVVNFLAGIITAAILLPIIGIPVLSLVNAANQSDPLFITGVVLVVLLAWLVSGVLLALPKAWNSTLWTVFYRAATVGLPGRVTPARPYSGQLPPTVPGGYNR